MIAQLPRTNMGRVERLGAIVPTDEEREDGQQLIETLRTLHSLRKRLDIGHMPEWYHFDGGYLLVTPDERVERDLVNFADYHGFDDFRAQKTYIEGSTSKPFVLRRLRVADLLFHPDWTMGVLGQSPAVWAEGLRYPKSRYEYQLDLAHHTVALLHRPELPVKNGSRQGTML